MTTPENPMTTPQATSPQRLDMAEVRQRLSERTGPAYWRGLEELAETPEFTELLDREFPRFATEWHEGVSRRNFIKLMGASLALAGVTGCARQPEDHIVSYVRQPEWVVPGEPLFFASTFPMGGYGEGVVVESHTGRPTKIEGNPEHPSSLGGTSAIAQASVLTLYDPDRAQEVLRDGDPTSWDAFATLFRNELEGHEETDGAGLRLLTGPVTSPTMAAQIQRMLERFPETKWHQYDPAGNTNAHAGARIAFGEDVSVHYDIAAADVILSLDGDFLASGLGCVRHARDFASKRTLDNAEANTMNRLYVAESSPCLTGATADHRLAVKAADIANIARAVAARFGVDVDSAGADRAEELYGPWINAASADLEAHGANALVIPGAAQPPVVHALAHAINMALGNTGTTVTYTDPVEAEPVDSFASLRELTEDLDAGSVETLVILGGNPAYTAPADLDFAENIEKAGTRIYMSLYADETAQHCNWLIPETHYLETWGDIRGHDGTVSLIQPMIAPLYENRSPHELLGLLAGDPAASPQEIVKAHWENEGVWDNFDRGWLEALSAGYIAGMEPSTKTVSLQNDLDPGAEEVSGDGLEIIFRADPNIRDGFYSNNGWLQELPKPLTKLTWDNAVLVSPATAEELDLATEDVVELSHDGRSLRAPVWVMPGHPHGSVTVHLGYGRERAGRVGDGAGFNAYALRTSAAPWHAAGATLEKTGQRYRLATTQIHHTLHDWSMQGRNLIMSAPIAAYLDSPDLFQDQAYDPQESVFDSGEFEYTGYAWGMTIDLNKCTGCNACVVACQAENNIPVVGKQEVINGREMHWIRVDRYYEGDVDDPEALHQPIPCMHCEKAPCEPVCPVHATVHGDEGLNEMVYNRCIGTRYCSNNCPYKVRRFNFLQYNDQETEQLKLQRNPNVTVRSRGVMEKCTYCVQRINKARIAAKREDRQIADGEIVMACEAACPAGAIVFGDINNEDARVAREKADPRNYGLLAHLNVRPRTTYLAKLKNPNPELETE